MIAYITKYALARGIEAVEVAEPPASDPNRICIPPKYRGVYLLRPDWHRTVEEAMARVDKMLRIKKNSLEKQVKRLDDPEYKAKIHAITTWKA